MTQEKQSQQKRAKRLYEIANQFATRANTNASEARKVNEEYVEQSARLERWKRIMSMVPVPFFSFFFFAVAISEFIFSYEIYREMVPRAPWVMAIAFFGVGIVLSEFLVYFISKAKRELLLYEAKRNPINDGKIDSDIESGIRKKALLRFVSGLVGSALLLFIIYRFSIDRALLEISSGERIAPIGIRDWIPLVLYAFEIIFGIYMFYLFKRMYLGYRVNLLKKKFDKLIDAIKISTAESVKKYQEAENENYDPIKLAVADDVNVSFYRKLNKSTEDKVDYIEIPDKNEDVFNVVLVDTNGVPLSKHISVITKYKFVDSGMTDKEGKCTIRIDTYPNDAIQFIFVRNAANAKDYQKIVENYDLDINETYTIIIE